MAVRNVGTLAVWLTMPRDDFQKGVKEAQRDIAKLSSTIGVFAVGAAASLTAFAVKSVMAFSEQEDAVSNMDAALNAAGDNVSKYSSRFQRFASEMQSKTIFGDEQVLGVMAYGKAMGIAADQIEDAGRAAIGLAAKYNIDLNTSMGLIAKANLGNTTALKRYGVILDENMTKEEKFAALLKIGGDSFGLAEAKTKTFSGSLAQLKNNFGEVEESFGKIVIEGLGLVDLMRSLSRVSLQFSNYLSGLDDATKNAIARTGLLAVGIVTLAAAYKSLMWTGILQGIAGLVKYTYLCSIGTAATATMTAGLIKQSAELQVLTKAAAANSIAQMSMIQGMARLPVLTFATTSALKGLASAVSVVAVAVYGFKLGEWIGQLGKSEDDINNLKGGFVDFYAKWLFGADAAKNKNKELDKELDDFNKKQGRFGSRGIVKKEEADSDTRKAYDKLNKIIADSQLKELEGQEKINEMRLRASNMTDVIATMKISPEKAEKIGEYVKLNDEISKLAKERGEEILKSEISLDEKLNDIKFKNAKTFDEKEQMLWNKRAEIGLKILNEKDLVKKNKLKEEDADLKDQIDQLNKASLEKRNQYVAPRLAGAVEKGTVEAYRAEIAASNGDTALFQQTAKNTDLTARGVNQLVNAFKPFGSLGVA